MRRVADAGAELVAGVGIVLPATSAIAAGLDLGAQIYRQLAAVRAARALDESLERMQPVVDRVTELIAAQLDEARVILVAATRIGEVKLRSQFADETGYLLALRKERVALYALTPLTSANVERLLQIERVERAVLARLAPMNTELRAGNLRLQSALQLTASTRQALADWSLAHRQLLASVRDGTPLDPQALTQSVIELRELVQRLRTR
ncbi:MAG: hypothetical protein H7125_04085 [Proteobacteria bacterium]|nr:hypothetical protein [Burkholderiales bacterium]